MTYLPYMKKMAALFNISTDKISIPVIYSIHGTLAVDVYLGRPLPANLTK